MSSSEKTLKHFVIVRFFPHKDPDFTQDIFDLDFVARQVFLAKNNCLKSLENQSNKNFEVVFLANEKYFNDKKFDFMFSELKNCTSLSVTFLKKDELIILVQKTFNEYKFVIQSRIDLDDFIFKDGIADTQSKIHQCDGLFSYGYLRGYAYFNGEMYPYYNPWRGVGHKSILQSIILESSFAKKIPFIGAYRFNHTKVKQGIERFLASRKLPFSENMFQQNDSTNAFIWFRHDANYSNMGSPFAEIPKYVKDEKPLTVENITKKQLEEEFGFYYDVKSIK